MMFWLSAISKTTKLNGLDVAFRRPVKFALLASLGLNLMALAMPIYTTQIYDRVMSSRSGSTLVAITVITLLAIGLSALLDLLRGIIFARASASLYAELESRVFVVCRHLALGGGWGRKARPIDDLELVRSFFASPVPGALFDLLFVPLIILVLFLIHPLIGGISLLLSIGILLLAVSNRRAMEASAEKASYHLRSATDAAEGYLRSIEAAMAMGFASRSEQIAARENREAVKAQIEASSRVGSITATVKGARQGAQILILAVAAGLTLDGAISSGSIIAASILFSRAQAPIDQAVGAWRQIFQVRSAWMRLLALISPVSDKRKAMPLPRPRGAVAFEKVVAGAPQGKLPILKGINFLLEPGDSLGVMGPSGSGKSTLARVMLGVWPSQHGTVRLDGADVLTLDFDNVGAAIGYLPQNFELMPGSVADNVCRLGAADPEGVVAAAREAGAHEMILGLPAGYDTAVGESGYTLSGGQRQRVALARALYGAPSLVVLDEPDSGMDRESQEALTRAIVALKARGATVVVITHRPQLLQSVDNLLILVDGQIQRLGRTTEMMTPVVSPSIHAARVGNSK